METRTQKHIVMILKKRFKKRLGVEQRILDMLDMNVLVVKRIPKQSLYALHVRVVSVINVVKSTPMIGQKNNSK
ncbi:hypothetical protein BACCIP111883_00400 [Sutcliffiella rhizosphaerae]|uniref:Uncharacterized protein n=1 Tax=Sutcliffiella rhizosphaerae TaxID=2880967 RepID=A0ABM8YIC9_9BACI|nr:hypothetical protein BACCIP111883_00400 [Sutcliffiella rhizosphaerae]